MRLLKSWIIKVSIAQRKVAEESGKKKVETMAPTISFKIGDLVVWEGDHVEIQAGTIDMAVACGKKSPFLWPQKSFDGLPGQSFLMTAEIQQKGLRKSRIQFFSVIFRYPIPLIVIFFPGCGIKPDFPLYAHSPVVDCLINTIHRQFYFILPSSPNWAILSISRTKNT